MAREYIYIHLAYTSPVVKSSCSATRSFGQRVFFAFDIGARVVFLQFEVYNAWYIILSPAVGHGSPGHLHDSARGEAVMPGKPHR